MKRTWNSLLALLAVCVVSAQSFAGDIVDTAVAAGKFKTLAAALGAADLVDTLKGDAPFTAFAPTDEAFAKLPEGTVETLLKPENKDMLTKVLTAHVVAGAVTAEDLVKAIKASSDGFFHFNTVSGDALSAQLKGGKVYIYDESGNAGQVTIANVMQSNGVIHVVDAVLVPK